MPDSFFRTDDIPGEVDPVGAVNVEVCGWPEHGEVSTGHAVICVAGRVGCAKVGFDFGDAEGDVGVAQSGPEELGGDDVGGSSEVEHGIYTVTDRLI